MDDEKQEAPAETQTTDKGYEIPVPERDDVMDVLRRAAQDVPHDAPTESN